ncbi:Uncharacterised protein [Bordetella pertussis]|nr:Uncharacterised protein [Bordetella pertussis]CPI66305.1 Uncharacterised protein [Bordetella pertussis]CPM07437.1 Uncharacterised protein [Bordetella pertussis]CPM65436.1 Uncharacterised protein [Bordetella pertussis]CPN62861.1 Uncharacterised protein [Bordetella pertussis]
MRYQQHAAGEFRERRGQRLARLHVQVVAGFVEQQQVGFLPDDQRQGETGFLAAGHGADLAQHGVAGKAEAAQVVAQLLLAHFRSQPREVRERRAVEVQHVELVLVEIADRQPARRAPRAGMRGQLVGQRLDQGALARAIGAQHADTAAGSHHQRDVAQNGLGAAVAGIHVFHGQQRVGHVVGRGDADIDARFGMDRRQRFHARERLDAALRLLGLGSLGLETIDEALQARGFARLAFVGDIGLAQAFGALQQEVLVAAAIALQLGLVEVQDGARHRVQEFRVVRNQQNRTGIGGQPFLQPQHGVKVQVVGWLVQQQQLRRRHQRARQRQPHAPAAGKAAHRLHPFGWLESQAREQLLGARGRAPGARLDQRRFGFGDLRALVVGQRGALGLQCAQVGVAVDDEFARRLRVGGNLLLHAGDAPARGQVQVAGVGVQRAGQQREQRRFARAVLADDADAFAGMHNEIGAVEQHFGAAAQGQARSAYHVFNCSRVSSRIWSEDSAVSSHTGCRSGKAASK